MTKSFFIFISALLLCACTSEADISAEEIFQKTDEKFYTYTEFYCEFSSGKSFTPQKNLQNINTSTDKAPSLQIIVNDNDGYAEIIGNLGKSIAAAIRKEDMLQIVESPFAGFTVLSIYNINNGRNHLGQTNFFAAYTRNMSIIGIPIVSVYHGICTAKK